MCKVSIFSIFLHESIISAVFCRCVGSLPSCLMSALDCEKKVLCLKSLWLPEKPNSHRSFIVDFTVQYL